MKFLSYYPLLLTDFFELDSKTNIDAVNYCLTLKQTTPGRKKTNVGGWQSENLFQKDIQGTPLQPYFLQIRKKIPDFAKISGFPKNQLVLGNSWININFKGDYNYTHNHGPLPLSGVFYLTENNSNIVFINENDNNSVTIKPTLHQLLIFPGLYTHKVQKNNEKLRISVAFNIVDRYGILYDFLI